MSITREQINRDYPFDADGMSQDDYDDLSRAMYENDIDEIKRITESSKQ